MKKKISRIIAPVMAAMLVLGGCGNKSDQTKENQSSQEETQQEKETEEKEPAVDEDELKEDTQEAQDPDAEQSADGDQEKDKAEIPEKSTLDIDYTSVDGLRMDKGSRISVVIKGTESAYWKVAKKGIEQAVSDLNEYLGYKGDDMITCTVEGPKEDNGVDEQVNILDMVLTENPAVICLSAVDMSSCEAQLEAAQEDGIPVVILDSGVNSDDDLVYAYCGTDNKAAGAEAAKRLCEAIGEEGEVAIMSHLQLSQSSQDRVEGFQEELTRNHPNVHLVRIAYEPAQDGDPTAEESVEDALKQYPDLKGYFSTNQSTGEAVLSVLEKHPDKNIQLVGVDMGDTQKKAIQEGKEAGTVCQNPYGMGYATIVAGVRASLGMETDKNIDSGFQWMDKDTIGLEEYERYVY